MNGGVKERGRREAGREGNKEGKRGRVERETGKGEEGWGWGEVWRGEGERRERAEYANTFGRNSIPSRSFCKRSNRVYYIRAT